MVMTGRQHNNDLQSFAQQLLVCAVGAPVAQNWLLDSRFLLSSLSYAPISLILDSFCCLLLVIGHADSTLCPLNRHSGSAKDAAHAPYSPLVRVNWVPSGKKGSALKLVIVLACSQ